MNDLLTWMVEIGGFAGVCLGFAYMYIRVLHNDLLESQNARNADKDAMIQKLLDLNNKWNETINSQIEVQEATKQFLVELKPAATVPPTSMLALPPTPAVAFAPVPLPTPASSPAPVLAPSTPIEPIPVKS